MSKSNSKPTFALTLESVPGSDVPAAVRLKRFLKAALRGYGLKCTECRETGPQSNTFATTEATVRQNTTEIQAGNTPAAPH